MFFVRDKFLYAIFVCTPFVVYLYKHCYSHNIFGLLFPPILAACLFISLMKRSERKSFVGKKEGELQSTGREHIQKKTKKGNDDARRVQEA